VAASCLVPENFEVPPGALVAGIPAKIKKTGLTPNWFQGAVESYVESGRAYLTGLRRLDPGR
jgi:carbonic anhydrase/acetyltransferase-like protein (isoleucine patch superfamily)